MVGVYISKQNTDYSIYVSLAAGIIILTLCSNYISPVINMIRSITEGSSINSEHINIVLKVIATAYIAQFASDACTDCGMQTISSKIDMASRFIILYLCLPLILSLFDYITSLL